MISLTTPTTDRLEQIYQKAHALPADESVRSNLTPSQAQRLRVWGEETLQAFTIQTLGLERSQSHLLLEQKATAVYAVMQSVNQLMGLRQVSPAETDIVAGQVSDDITIRLLKNLRWLTGRVCPPDHLLLLKRFHQKRPFLDQQTGFDLLIKLLNCNE